MCIYRDAVDCLFPQRANGWSHLQRGFDMAKQLAQAVVMEGGLVITRGQVQGGKQAGVWICDLSDISIQVRCEEKKGRKQERKGRGQGAGGKMMGRKHLG